MTDEQLAELAERIYWAVENGQRDKYIKLLRELYEKAYQKGLDVDYD